MVAMVLPCLQPISCHPQHSGEPACLSSSPPLRASIPSVCDTVCPCPPWGHADICCAKFSLGDPPSSLPVGKQLFFPGWRLAPGELCVQLLWGSQTAAVQPALPCSSAFSRVCPEPHGLKLMFSVNKIPSPVAILTPLLQINPR